MMMRKTPRIKRHISVIPHNENEVELKTGIWNATSFMLRDDSGDNVLLPILLSLDGNKTINDIASENDVKRSDIEGIIDHLKTVDMIETTPANAIDYYLEMMPTLAAQEKTRLDENALQPVYVGDPECFEVLQSILQGVFGEKTLLNKTDELMSVFAEHDDDWLHNGLLLERRLAQFSDWQNHFVIFVSKTINPIVIGKFNRIAYELNIPWLHAAIDGPFVFVGPTFYGKSGPCYDCFESRITMNIRESANYLKYKSALCHGLPMRINSMEIFKPINHVLCAHVALEATNFWLTRRSFTQGKVLSIYLPTMEIIYNDVARFSGCKTCGLNASRDEHQLYFEFEQLLENTHEH